MLLVACDTASSRESPPLPAPAYTAAARAREAEGGLREDLLECFGRLRALLGRLRRELPDLRPRLFSLAPVLTEAPSHASAPAPESGRVVPRCFARSLLLSVDAV